MSRFTLSDGAEIEYDLTGPEDGPVVVLLHGARAAANALSPQRRPTRRQPCAHPNPTSLTLKPPTHPPPSTSGWSGSRRYYDLNAPALAAAGCRVVAPDLRHHGGSGKTPHGRRVSRLAADLGELLEGLGIEGATVVGASMGCAVIWAYVELFGHARLVRGEGLRGIRLADGGGGGRQGESGARARGARMRGRH